MKNLQDMVFDDYVVENLDGVSSNGMYFWNCKCVTCNSHKIFSRRRLMDERPVLCKEHRKYVEPDIVGKQFGFMIVDSLSDNKTEDGYNIWDCHCSVCGNKYQRTYAQLKATHGQSCGCIRNRKNSERSIDMSGKIYNKNIFVKCLSDQSKNGNMKWDCICLLCGSEFVGIGTNIRKGITKSCGCARFDKLRNQRFHDLTNQLFGDVLVESFAGYSNQRAMWNCLCKLCNTEFVSSGHDLLAGDIKSCGCGKSYPERRIVMFLSEHNISFERQKRFMDCRDKRPLPFDFYISSHNLAIEYDGELHYIPTTLNNDLETTQKHDKIKTQYCNDNNIRLLRIPYWEKDNIESILTDWLFLNDAEDASSPDVDLSA